MASLRHMAPVKKALHRATLLGAKNMYAYRDSRVLQDSVQQD